MSTATGSSLASTAAKKVAKKKKEGKKKVASTAKKLHGDVVNDDVKLFDGKDLTQVLCL